MPDMGKSDVMTTQAQTRYKEAVPDAYAIPKIDIPDEPAYDNTKEIPKNKRVKLSNGKLGTAEDERKLQEFLKNRGK